MKEKGKPNPPVKEVPIEWKDKNQKIRCEAYLSQIHEAYKNAKYFSIAGDACNTGRYADQFLQLVHACEKDCPENLLAKEGYKDILIKNVETLLELGRKKCLQEGLTPPAGEENKNETN